MTSREAIFAALFAQVSAAAGLVTTSRTLQLWTDVAPAQQPALFQAEGKQAAIVQRPKPTKWAFHAELAVYCHRATAGGVDVVSQLNTIVDAIVAALEPPAGADAQTLGGLVTDCRIAGDIETDEGRLGEQAVALIPIEIIANV